MGQPIRMQWLAGLLALGVMAGIAIGGEEPKTESLSCPGTYHQCIARWATPADSPAYDGYYVGGGCPCYGEGPYPLEGTWGWDYFGCHYSRNVILNWCHNCGRTQNGQGSYDPNGFRGVRFFRPQERGN